MYALLSAYFAGTTRPTFDSDLDEKESVILLRDPASGRVGGFSTLMRMTERIDGRDLVAFYSGDTIVDRDFWGETSLGKLWGRAVFTEAARLVADRTAARVYWFLICSGYRTWRFLPVCFREYHPNRHAPTPPRVQRILDAFGRRKFGLRYAPDTGVVRLDQAAPLRRGVSDLGESRLLDPDVAFFARRNPGHVRGDELACLAEIVPSNLTPAGRRAVGLRGGRFP